MKKAVFYLMTHSTHFIYSYMASEEERGVLFNDTLNTFYLGLYGIRRRMSVLFNDTLNTFYLVIYGYMASEE